VGYDNQRNAPLRRNRLILIPVCIMVCVSLVEIYDYFVNDPPKAAGLARIGGISARTDDTR